MGQCWECESEASPTIELILPVPGYGQLAVALCPPCHRDVVAPVITQIMAAEHVGSSVNAPGPSIGR
jgi:hypothetical protein